MTKVSIITPVYNQAKYLPETLDSVLAQTYQDWECVIVNDGSIDDTENIAKKYCDIDKRFKYLFQKNSGTAVARNNGILNSCGEFILPLDSDDLISKNYLEEAFEVFKNNPETTLVYCEAELFGDSSGKWDLPDYSYKKILFGNIIFCTAMFKRADYDKTMGYNPIMEEGLEDWDFWLSLLSEESIVYRIPKIHFFYRTRNNSRNSRSINNKKLLAKLYKQAFENHKDLYEPIINPVQDHFDIEQKNQEILDLRQIIQQKNQEIDSMKSSKFWKIRDKYLKLKSFLK